MTTTTATTTTHRPPYRLTARGVLAGEWTKFLSLRSSWITLVGSMALLVALGALAAGTFDAAGGSIGGPGGGPPDGVAPGGSPDALGLALAGSTFAALTVGILGVLLAAGEYTTGMIRSTLAAVPTRLPVLWAKAAIAGGTALVAMTAGLLLSFAVGTALLPSGSTLGLGDEGVLRGLLLGGLYLALVAVFGVALGVLIRSSAGGIALLAGLLLVVPGLITLLPSSWSETLSPYLPSSAGSAMTALQQTGDALSPGAGLAVVAGWVVVALAGAAYRLARTDA